VRGIGAILRLSHRVAGQLSQGCLVNFLSMRVPVAVRRVGSVVVATTLAVALLAAPANASVAPQLASQVCSGTLVVDIQANVAHEADGGVAGNVWALDSGTERARVWQQDAHTFCVIQTFTGAFTTFAGTSPGGTGTVAAGVTGSVVSRQRYVVTADFTPVIPTSGFLGSFDFGCDQRGTCPGNVAFGPLLFSNITAVTGATFAEIAFDRHGLWLQTNSQTFGDITR
jgi:hypothetical protein